MLLSIVVLSYNRPLQVERIIKCFIGYDVHDVELIVKDDLSPRLAEIDQVVSHCKKIVSIPIRLHVNNENVGYDVNLIQALEMADSDYVFLLSDDDYLNVDAINSVLDVLRKREHDVYFSPYTLDGSVYRNSIAPYQFGDIADVIYNSVLFSGLIFRTASFALIEYDRDRLAHCIYSQVYFVIRLIWSSKSYGVIPSNFLILGGDGENFFGKNEAAVNASLLADRRKVTSNLAYQQFLLKVVHMLALDLCSSIEHKFWRSYQLRLIGYGFKVRALSFSHYVNLIKFYSKKDVKGSFLVSFIFLILTILPSRVAQRIYSMCVKMLRNSG